MKYNFIFFFIACAILSIAYGQKLTEPSFSSLPYAEPIHNPTLDSTIFPAFKSSPSNYLPEVQAIDITDILITNQTNYDQSENSIFIHPQNSSLILNSNNTTSNPWNPPNGFGVSEFTSNNTGQTWGGTLLLTNSQADPAVAISDLTGRYFVNFINNSNGQTIAYSDNSGSTWTYVTIAGTYTLDKNHLWVDNSKYRIDGTYNQYFGNLYVAWFQIEDASACTHASSNDDQIMLTRSTNNGLNWSTPVNISTGTNAVCHNQAVNIQTDPNGLVVACWVVYDAWAGNEVAIGFNKSSDGGVTWGTASRIQNIAGHRITPLGGSKSMRHNSFPSMTINQQNGNIYIVWTNRGIPGGSIGDPDIYMIKSSDQGVNWSTPVRVNQDATTNDQWFPWIACDEISGALIVTYYDSRDFVNNDQANTYISISYDNGATWTDYKISDVSWQGDGIPNANGYAGDYIGIDISNGLVAPVWSDDRSGHMLAYTQPFIIPCTVKDLVLCNGTISSQQDYKFNSTITVGGTSCSFSITSTGKSDMQATKEIIFDDGFVSEGELYAHIVPCDDSQLRIGNFDSTAIISKPDFPASLLNNSFQCKIFPNPSYNGIFQLKTLSRNNETINISLINILGEVVYQSQIKGGFQTIDISSYPKGIYTFKVQNEEKLFSYKIIYQ